jgi:small GTP-binding protein
MVQTAKSNETYHTLKSKIITIYEYFTQHGDKKNAVKVKQLAKKLENREFLIAFCGHFSSGKSTMINQIIGENLLPSSPIPTSANLVKVKTGEDYAKVFFKKEKPRLYLAPYDYDLVKNYCKDGDEIEEIEISHSESPLPPNTVIMDTPGIDSADDAHRIATESAIHLADLIFYVMDYNHVQAELNFLFTQELTKAGKEVYLVINQIDKHNEEELSFSDFKKSVLDAYLAWGVQPARIFYTSLKDKNHSYNEYKELQHFIDQKLQISEESLVLSIYQSLKNITKDHLYQVRTLDEEELLPNIEILNELSDEEKKEITEKVLTIGITLENIGGKLEETKRNFDEAIAQILKNAYIMPFQTRDLAKDYLEACQLEFKVGFLFSKQKTEMERSSRLKAFYQDIIEKVKAQLEWHLKEFLLIFIKENGLDFGELLSKAQNFSINVPVELLINAVKPGARLSGEYVLHYTDDVAMEIIKLAKAELDNYKTYFLHSLQEKTGQLKEKYEAEYLTIKQYVNALSELKAFNERMKAKEEELDKLVIEVNNKEDFFQLFNKEDEKFQIVKGKAEQKNNKTKSEDDVDSEPTKEINLANVRNGVEENQVEQTVKRLQNASRNIEDLPGFQRVAAELKEKATRLDQKGFTVALFGAFSAGKSSFANALIGKRVLPVSPNPTTAAINKIKPVTSTHPHGTVLVKFKEKTAMLQDVNRALKAFDYQVNDLTEGLRKIDQIIVRKRAEEVQDKTHFTFLNAFKKGYETYGNLLGTTQNTELEEFGEFVAKEEKSCYVEWIELYYDCELTRKGITLVDTPGADSINARHTGVAFDYIKNSDAILFVTYYNHAFSRADREFLIQLGRVKDSFQMDKMFFLINAIDLAEDDAEKKTVVQYVKNQLLKYGIRNPHLYPLSSLLALQEIENQEEKSVSGMGHFQSDFSYFISNDLTEMTVKNATREIERVQQLVNKLIQSSTEDKTVKDEKRKDMERQKQNIKEFLQTQNVTSIQGRLLQESEELIYYIKQRVFLRFGDFFKESFNPSTLREDGRNLKTAIKAALDEFLESIGYDFAQEMRATTVRLDRLVEKVVADYQSALLRHLQQINGDLSFSSFEIKNEKQIDFTSAFVHLDRQIFTKAISYFKNPKSFFEKNEKRFMAEELERILVQPAEAYLKKESTRLNQYYLSILTEEFGRLLNHVKEETENFYLSLLSTLDGGVPIERLIEIYENISSVEGDANEKCSE